MGLYEATTRLLIPGARIGGVIGRGGEVIKSIREMSGARISIASAGADDRESHFRLVRRLILLYRFVMPCVHSPPTFLHLSFCS